MKQRQRRKAMQRKLARPIRSRAWRSRANAFGRSVAVRWMRQPDFEAIYPRCDSADAFAYMAQFFQEPQPAPYTELELAAQHVVQQAELFDRSLPHYFHEGNPWEAIPHPHCMAASRTHYAELIEQQSNQLRVGPSDIRREARRYSTSPAYTHWLREHPPT